MSDTGYEDFEFERRFWVRDLPVDLLDESPTVIVQSYFLADEGYALRVRVQTSGGAPAGTRRSRRCRCSTPTRTASSSAP